MPLMTVVGVDASFDEEKTYENGTGYANYRAHAIYVVDSPKISEGQEKTRGPII